MIEPLWNPTARQIEQANLTKFLRAVGERHARIIDFESLWQWSVDAPDEFWAELWTFCDVLASRRWDSVLDDPHKMPGATWFRGARLNFAENLLRYDDDREAIVFWNERGRQQSLTYAELRNQVSRTAAALRSAGVVANDRVAAFLPNIPETVVAMLAATSLGATWSSTSPDFGLQGVLDRFGQIQPKILFVADGYQYNGKQFACLERVADIVGRIPSIEKTVVVPYQSSNPDVSQIPRAVAWDEFVSGTDDAELTFDQLPFDHPLYVLYSSGTTGVPKCIVHGAGGTLIQHLKEHVLHVDLRRDDRVFYYTTCGWMMWNWLVSSLAVGATVVLYDGSPFFPGPEFLWDMAQQERLTVFGTSAKYISALEKTGAAPIETHELTDLRTVLSTGSPLLGSSFDYVYTKIKHDVCLSSISGGTDIVSCFALGNPIGPVYRGQLQTRGLGMNVRVFNDEGQAVTAESGELVCISPFPSMPIYFWNDEDGKKYHDAYFGHFANVWRHGDWVELTEQGGMNISGRSDAVLNPGGVRIGTAEIYRQVERLDEVQESIVVGQDWEGDVRIVLFVKLRSDHPLDEALVGKIKNQIRKNTTPRHVPSKVLQVTDIPRTISGKIVELAVRNVIHGREVKNQDALANPESLRQFENLVELQSP